MPLDNSNLKTELRKANQRVVGEALTAMRSMALEAFSELTTEVGAAGTYGSPVASGRYVASMRLAINEIDTTTAPEDASYEYPEGKGPRPLPPRTIANQRISAAAARLQTLKLGDVVYITNSVPYVRRIEIGKHSWQAPDGVFGPTVRNLVRKFGNTKLKISTDV